MTTGGERGGRTNDRDLWLKMWSFKDRRKSWEAVYERERPPGFRWVHEGFGASRRMLGVNAVIGRIQLCRMSDWHASRISFAQRNWLCARELEGLRVPLVPDDFTHTAYKCYVFAKPEQLRAGWSRDRIPAEIAARGVPCFLVRARSGISKKLSTILGGHPLARLVSLRSTVRPV